MSLTETFKRVKKWIDELKAFNKNTVLAIAGNKCDLKKFDVDKDEAQQYAEAENAKLFYTSAKTGEGLNEIFLYITKEIASQQKLANLSNKESKNKKLVISQTKKVENSGCCK